MSPLEFVGGRTLADLGDGVREATELAGWSMANDLRDRLQHNIEINTPVDTGRLRESYRVRMIEYGEVRGTRLSEMAWTGGVYTEVDYAEFVERGTGLWGPEHKPYLILPKSPGGLLSWVSPQGFRVFAKSVWHPGSPGAAMFRIGAVITEAEADEWSYRALRQWEKDVVESYRGTLVVSSVADFPGAGFS